MRISDWSSDVCSSDLQPVRTGRRLWQSDRNQSWRRHFDPLWSYVQADCGAEPARTTRAGHRPDEIGRASCRERVCSVRVDLGGRRIIKKKKKVTKRTVHDRTKKETRQIEHNKC